MLTRREFLGAGLGAAVAAERNASWRQDALRHERPSVPHDAAASGDGHQDGGAVRTRYRAVQDDIPQYLKQPPDQLKKVLDASGLALCTVGSGGVLDASRLQETIESNTPAPLRGSLRLHALKVNLSKRISADNLSPANAKTLARNLNEVGKRTADAGVRFAFHPHAWTLVERQPELDMMMEMTDPKLVFLVLDTGHATLGGIDPVKCLRDYYSRITAIHLKDAEAKYSTAGGWKGPAPSEAEHNRVNLYKRLGAGGVDFPAFFRVLRERSYDGWVTLDFDAPRPGEGTVEQDMNSHKKYLLETLHADLRS
jgi:inosose dehydratase